MNPLTAIKSHPDYPFSTYREGQPAYELVHRYWAALFAEATGHAGSGWESWLQQSTDRDGSAVFSAISPDGRRAVIVNHYAATPDDVPYTQGGPYYPFIAWMDTTGDGTEHLTLNSDISEQSEAAARYLLQAYLVRGLSRADMAAEIERLAGQLDVPGRAAGHPPKPQHQRPHLDPTGCLTGDAAALARATGETQYRYEKACRHGLMAFNQNDLYVGRSLYVYGEWAEFELRLLGTLLRPGDVVIDAGANIGTHTVYFANAIGPNGRVYAFEPQRHVHELLWNNVVLNGLLTQVTCERAAVGMAPGMLLVPDLPAHLILNFGALALGDHAEGDSVPVVVIDDLALTQCRLIKIDVEGMEAEVLKGAERTIRRLRPFLFIENDQTERSEALLAQIRALGYRILVHLAPCFNPGNFAGESRNLFPHAAGVNLLCVPVEATFDPSLHACWDPHPVAMHELLDACGLDPKLTPLLNGTDMLKPLPD